MNTTTSQLQELTERIVRFREARDWKAHDLNIDLVEAFSRKMAENDAKYPADQAKGRHDKYTSCGVASPGIHKGAAR